MTCFFDDWKKGIKKALNWIWRQWTLWVLLLLLALMLPGEGLPPGDLDAQVTRAMAGRRFDFVSWEAEAVMGKLLHSLIAPQRYMAPAARHDFVIDYLARVGEIQRLDREMYLIYTDPEIDDADAASADLQQQLTAQRAKQHVRQPLVEAILQEQVATVLVDQGFGVLGQELPPVSAHFTPLPTLLVISPRDRIENVFSLSLIHGLDPARRNAIEEQIDQDFGVSSLITNIGGLAAYPSMLLESGWAPWIAEVTSHEWTHHYLTVRPLGWNYLASGETRTINETVASIVGKEVGREVVARYYPELLPPEPDPAPPQGEDADLEPEPEPEPPPFDFRAEMRETRIRADELLAQSQIEEAEAYMEQRRQMFVDEGYYIRKLNQAYFAFHGSYADAPGAAGEDPIGPTVVALRQQSADLYTFVRQVARVTTLSELEALLEQ